MNTSKCDRDAAGGPILPCLWRVGFCDNLLLAVLGDVVQGKPFWLLIPHTDCVSLHSTPPGNTFPKCTAIARSL